MSRFRIFILLLSGFVFLLAMPQREVNETRKVNSDAKITISNVSGELIISGWDKNEVKITGTLEEDVKELKVTGDKSRLSIEVELKDRRHNRHGSAYLEILVPQHARLEAETVSAEIKLANLESAYGEFSSVSGSIDSECDVKELSLQSVSGSIHSRGSGEEMKAQTVSGSIEIKGQYPIMSANSVSGSLEIQTGSFKEGSFQSTSGSIEFKGDPKGEGRMKLKSVSGSVTLYLPRDVSADFDVSTFSGRIENDLTDDRVNRKEFGPGADLGFTTGKGEFRIRASSFSGSVRLRRK